MECNDYKQTMQTDTASAKSNLRIGYYKSLVNYPRLSIPAIYPHG